MNESRSSLEHNLTLASRRSQDINAGAATSIFDPK